MLTTCAICLFDILILFASKTTKNTNFSFESLLFWLVHYFTSLFKLILYRFFSFLVVTALLKVFFFAHFLMLAFLLTANLIILTLKQMFVVRIKVMGLVSISWSRHSNRTILKVVFIQFSRRRLHTWTMNTFISCVMISLICVLVRFNHAGFLIFKNV
jgi:hypothetical protein